MPGVTVLSPNNPLHSAATSGSKVNGSSRIYDDMNVSEILSSAKDAVTRETRGATPMSMIKTARRQVIQGKDYEAKGNLKSALGAYTQAAALAKITLDSAEMKAEAGRGLLTKEFYEFFENEGSDLAERKNHVEDKLKAFEKSPSPAADPPPRKTIADRLKSLQDNGLSVGTNSKRFSRELPMSPPASSPSFPSTTSISRQSVQSVSPPAPAPSAPIPPPTISAPPPSTHTLVSPSTFGPPSPASTSSPAASPRLPERESLSLSEFAQAFPPIDELDEVVGLNLPPAPTSPPGKSGSPKYPEASVNGFTEYGVPVERPSSTPLTPTTNAFASQPASPSRSPVPPPLTTKPSTAGLSGSGMGSSFSTSSGSTTPTTDRPPLPVSNSISPKDLDLYMQCYKVLLLDVRHRADFDRERINHTPVVCVEPSILMRERVTGQTLEDALVVAPAHEGVVFSNREKFDLVVMYDQNSTAFGSQESPINVLVGAIYEGAIQKMLRRVPKLLIGGLDQWKAEMGETRVRRSADGKHSPGYQEPTPLKGVNGHTHTQSVNIASGVVTNGTMSPSLSGSVSGSPSFATMNGSTTSPRFDSHQQWASPRLRSDTNPFVSTSFEQRTPAGVPMTNGDHRSTMSVDHISHSRTPAETSPPLYQPPHNTLVRRPAISRAPVSASAAYPANLSGPTMMHTISNGSTPITYPQFPSRVTPNTTGSFGSPFMSPPAHYDNIASPPQASVNPSFPRRRTDYIDQSQEALSGSGLVNRGPIDYPELSSQISRPLPVAAPPIALDRQENHNRTIAPPQSSAPVPPRLKQDYNVVFWYDTQIGTSGLKNLGNTCYMNAPIQCLSATVPFAQFFTNGRWREAINMLNKMGSQGKLVQALATLLRSMWQGDLPYITPIEFRKMVVSLNSQYSGSDQHDSQEFLSFLLDIIHEDLNRVITKPVWNPTPEEEAELERLPPQIASEREWKAWKMRNDSLIVDYFQGQLRNRLQCMTCNQTSTTYNVFSMLQLPVPSKSSKIPLQKCLDAFFNHEVLEKDDAWDCPRCKTKRKATKQLSLARLPPILLINLKRFETHGRFSDKVDTFVDFPLKGLDLTNLMPPPLPAGADKGQVSIDPNDPRTQLPPYKYDLYGVTNHYGNLSSGHYTAYIASRGGWMTCDDSSVRPVDPKQVVNQKAYVLFYKRVKA